MKLITDIETTFEYLPVPDPPRLPWWLRWRTLTPVKSDIIVCSTALCEHGQSAEARTHITAELWEGTTMGELQEIAAQAFEELDCNQHGTT